MTQRNPILLAAAATTVGAVALVFAIRALIPSGADVPTLATHESSTEDVAPRAHEEPDVAVSVAVVAAPDVLSQPALAQPEPPPTQLEAPVLVQPALPDVVETPVAAATNVPIEPLTSIRPDIDRLRAQIAELNARIADAGANQRPAMLRSMALLVNGAPIVRRLTAGDSTFADQVTRYRAAMSPASANDPNARASLRGSIFSPQYAERAAAFDDVMSLTR